MGRGWEYISVDLTLTYVDAKFDLARWLVEKVGQHQRLCDCVNSQIFEGYPGVGGTDGEVVVDFFFIELNPAYLVAKFELTRWLVEKVGQRQRLCNCVNSQIFEGYPGVGETDGKWVVNFFLIELNPAYVVTKFELASCLVEKVEQGQRLCNCVNSQIFEGYPQARGGWRREVCQIFW